MNFNFPAKEVEALEMIAAATGRSKTDIVREAVREKVAELATAAAPTAS